MSTSQKPGGRKPPPLNLNKTRTVPGTLRTPRDLAQDVAMQCLSPTVPQGLPAEVLARAREIEVQQRQIIASREYSDFMRPRCQSAPGIGPVADSSDGVRRSTSMSGPPHPFTPVPPHADPRSPAAPKGDGAPTTTHDPADSSRQEAPKEVGPLQSKEQPDKSDSNLDTAQIQRGALPGDALRVPGGTPSKLPHASQIHSAPQSATSTSSLAANTSSSSSLPGAEPPTPLGAASLQSLPPFRDAIPLHVRRGTRPVLLDVNALQNDTSSATHANTSTPASARKRTRFEDEEYAEQKAFDDEDESHPNAHPRLSHNTASGHAFPFEAGLPHISMDKKARFMELCSEMWDLLKR